MATLYTPSLVFTVLIVSIGAFQYGFHIAELNAPQDAITCKLVSDAVDCIPMTASQIGMVNSAYSVGGLLSALVAGILADKYGRRRISFLNCFIQLVGSLCLGSSKSISQMIIGRLIVGMGAGSAIVVAPVYLNEIAPLELRGAIGTMSQVSVNFGILIAQFLGYFWSQDVIWRRILYFGAIIAAADALLLPFIVESPKWLAVKGMTSEAKSALSYLRSSENIDDEFHEWNLSGAGPSNAIGGTVGGTEDTENDSAATSETQTEADTLLEPPYDTSRSQVGHKVSAMEFLTNPEYRRPAIACLGIMVCQQLSGINAIIFYGVSIFKESLPAYASLINIFISIVNLGFTMSVSYFIGHYGRKTLLLTSIGGMAVSATLLAFAMTINFPLIASFGAIMFVILFAIGMGPIPFLLVPELVPPHVSATAQSASTTANWISTFVIAFFFPILQTSLGTYVFFIFTFTGMGGYWFIKTYIPETRYKNYSEIWSK